MLAPYRCNVKIRKWPSFLMTQSLKKLLYTQSKKLHIPRFVANQAVSHHHHEEGPLCLYLLCTIFPWKMSRLTSISKPTQQTKKKENEIWTSTRPFPSFSLGGRDGKRGFVAFRRCRAVVKGQVVMVLQPPLSTSSRGMFSSCS